MVADLYHPKELWRAGLRFYKIANHEDPFTATTGGSADLSQAKNEISRTFQDTNYKGFIRANFESLNFSPRVLKRWKQNTGFVYPDVIRMTGVYGMTEQSMKNLLTTVNPIGGILIFSEGNTLGMPRNMMWQVFKNKNNVRVKLLHSSDDSG